MIKLIRRWLEKRKLKEEAFCNLIEDVLAEHRRKAAWNTGTSLEKFKEKIRGGNAEYLGMTTEEIALEIDTNRVWKTRLEKIDK